MAKIDLTQCNSFNLTQVNINPESSPNTSAVISVPIKASSNVTTKQVNEVNETENNPTVKTTFDIGQALSSVLTGIYPRVMRPKNQKKRNESLTSLKTFIQKTIQLLNEDKLSDEQICHCSEAIFDILAVFCNQTEKGDIYRVDYLPTLFELFVYCIENNKLQMGNFVWFGKVHYFGIKESFLQIVCYPKIFEEILPNLDPIDFIVENTMRMRINFTSNEPKEKVILTKGKLG